METQRLVKSLHDEAMMYAQDAFVARQKGDLETAQELAARGFPFEKEAAERLKEVLIKEAQGQPTSFSAALRLFVSEKINSIFKGSKSE